MPAREPILHPVPIKALHPTQMTVGLREVAAKRKQWLEHGKDARAEFLGRHMIPAVMGPKTAITRSITTISSARSTTRG